MRVLASIVLAVVWTGVVHAQAMEWRVQVMAEVDTNDGHEQLMFWSDRSMRSFLPRRPLLSHAGEPGLVLAGNAIVEPYRYRIPHVAKVAAKDGRVLWRWQSSVGRFGRIRESVIGSDGSVYIAGWEARDGLGDLLLARIDGANGQTQWRAAELPGLRIDALDVALDRSGNAIATGSVYEGARRQIVSSHDAVNGTLRWLHELPDGDGMFDKFLVAADRQDDILAASPYWIEGSVPPVQGVQIAKLRGSDGALVWMRRFPCSDCGYTGVLDALLPSVTGDVLIAANGSLYALEGGSGSIRWEYPLDGFSLRELVEDAEGTRFVGGETRFGGETSEFWMAAIRALDQSGTERWRATYSEPGLDPGQGPVAKLLIQGDGNLLATWTTTAARNPIEEPLTSHLGQIDAVTGRLRWHVRFGDPDNPCQFDSPESLDVAPDGAVLISGESSFDFTADRTWTAYRLTDPSTDIIFMADFGPG